MIKIKRIYEPAAESDGYRVLVDRLWPRGLGKNKAGIHHWAKDTAPSEELRKWFNHDQAKWVEFKKRYFAELAANHNLLLPLIKQARSGTITLLYAARDADHNNAVALRDYLEGHRI